MNNDRLAKIETTVPNLATQHFAKQLSPRKGTPDLSLDVNIATCEVLAALTGGTALPEDAFDLLIERNRILAQSPEGEILDSLTRQSLLLEQLWLHFSARAAVEGRSDHAAILMGAALKCQRALGNVLGTLHHLDQEKRDAAALEPV